MNHVALGLCGPVRCHPVGGRGRLRCVRLDVPSSVNEAMRGAERLTFQHTQLMEVNNPIDCPQCVGDLLEARHAKLSDHEWAW